ncbi:MAG: multidrug transporter, partial [Kingella oralis]
MKPVLNHSLTAVALSIALSACNLAPKYEKPNVELPSDTFKYDAQRNGEQAFQAASLGWQDYFADPRLHALIEIALKNNTDLRTANLNVEQVRAQYAIT